MRANKEIELYNQGYMDGFDDAQNAHIEPIKPKIKDVKEKSFPKDEDYWTRLEHTYAGMAMQGLVANRSIVYGQDFNESLDAHIAVNAVAIAHALVQKLKEKEERK